VINGVIAPVLLTLVLIIGASQKIMGNLKTYRWQNLLGWLTVLLMSGVALLMFFNIF
jgi:Mn2+/Fe2+ NRAMP family transporter